MHTLCPGPPSGTLPLMKTVSGFVCVLAAGVVAGCGVAPADPTKGARVVDVVASANQWGDVVRQIGGRHADVASIVSSPDQDPHLYTSSAREPRRPERPRLRRLGPQAARRAAELAAPGADDLRRAQADRLEPASLVRR